MIFHAVIWNIDPEIIELGPFSIRYYGVLFALAFVLGYYIIQKIFKNEGISVEVLDRLTLYMIIGTVVGARLGHCLFYEPDFYLSNPLEILKIWRGGLASHGAAIGILIMLYLFARKEKKPYVWILDRIVIVVALAGFFIRTGNLMNSEIYGIKTSLPWGFVFKIQGEILPKHPTQIYEGLAYLAIFFLLYRIYFKTKGNFKPGLLFSLFLILVFTARFFIEFIKENQVRFESELPLNMGQFLSIPFVIIGLILLYYSTRKKPKRQE